MAAFFRWKRGEESVNVRDSMIGGKINAKAELLMAPTNEMKRPMFGITAANITKINNIQYPH